MTKLKYKIVLVLLTALAWAMPFCLNASEGTSSKNQACAVYLTGIGCPACAHIEPVLLSEMLSEYPGSIVIEYEIYQARQANLDTSQEYFKSYLPPGSPPGIPFLVLGGEPYLGPEQIKEAATKIKEKPAAKCSLPDRSLVALNQLKPSSLTGRPRIWTKNRVFILKAANTESIYGPKRDTCVAKLIQTDNIVRTLQNIEFKEAEPRPVHTSRGKIEFENAVLVGSWLMQWDGVAPPETFRLLFSKPSFLNWLFLILGFISGSLFTLYLFKRKKITSFLKTKRTSFFIVGTAIVALTAFFIAVSNIDPSLLRTLGTQLPLPVFTFVVALIDSFNPCNMFVLTVLLALLISSSASRRRFYLVGFIFVLVVFLFYFFFMAAWLNIFRYMKFAGPLRITIAVIAITAGLINCKELFFFKKGPSLMIPEKQKGILYSRMRNLTGIINKGSLPLLISASTTLAIFSSFVEIPCTAVFPLLYVSVLSAQVSAEGFGYISYLVLYNLIYVIPLLTIIAILGVTFQAKKVSEKQVQIIKFIGGIIMIALGLILLVNPGLIGASL